MYCSKCGSQLNAEDKFCNGCGNAIEQQNQAESILQQPVANQNISQQGSNVVLSIEQQPRKGKGKAVKILCIIGIVIAVFYLIGSFVLNKGLKPDSNTYYGNGYELKYDYNWRIGNLQGGQETLIKDSDNFYIIPIGKSNLSQHSQYNFDTESGKKQIYDEFYSLWTSSMSSQSVSLFHGSNGFSILKGNIYYATIDYGKSSDKLNGQYYILISKEDDIVLAFMSNTKPENFNKANAEVLEMLKEIKIIDNSSSSNDSSNKDNNVESFTPGNTEKYSAFGYMDYDMPECWTYSEELSASMQYKSYIFKYKDGKSFAEVKANTPINMTTFETGTSIERMRDNIKSAGLTIKSENTKMYNEIKWYDIVTEDYDNPNLVGNFHSKYLITFSKNNKNLYMFEFYVSNTLNEDEIKYMNDSIDYILNNAKLYKTED